MTLDQLAIGQHIWHNGIPFRLIRFVWKQSTAVKWIVAPLYVQGQCRGLLISKTDDFHLDSDFREKAKTANNP